MDKHLFIDLEETLIDSWHSMHLGPKNRVIELLDEHFPQRKIDFLPTKATLWSFAVGNDAERKTFNTMMKSWLEGVFDLDFVRVVTCEEMLANTIAFKGWRKDALEWTEFSQTFGKEGSFEHWVLMHHKGPGHFVLIDDVVPNRTVHWHDSNQIIQSVRV